MASSRVFRAVAGFAVAIPAMLVAGVALSQATARTTADGVYADAQAERGHAAYNAHCASCHGDALEGSDVNPSLSGSSFQSRWQGQTLADLTTRIRTTMPLDDPGALGTAAVTDIVAYMLKVGEFPAGAQELPADTDAQRGVTFQPAHRP